MRTYLEQIIMIMFVINFCIVEDTQTVSYIQFLDLAEQENPYIYYSAPPPKKVASDCYVFLAFLYFLVLLC